MTRPRMEIWIRSNRRALLWGMSIPLGLGLLGVLLVLLAPPQASWAPVGIVFGWLLLLFSGSLIGGLLWMLWIPRVSYRDGRVFFYLRLGGPVTVPLEALEIFLVGSQEAAAGPTRQAAQVACVIVRMKDREKQWHDRDVSPALGEWKDGYVTIRGTWCEPVSPTLLKRLNRRLRELQRERVNCDVP